MSDTDVDIVKFSHLFNSSTKGKKGPTETPAEREARITLYAERVAAGLDIWTGKPRKGISHA